MFVSSANEKGKGGGIHSKLPGPEYVAYFLMTNQVDALISQIHFGIETLHVSNTLTLSIVRNFSLYTQQRYKSYRFADSLRAGSGWNILIFSPNLYDIYHYCVYSENFLMMVTGTVRNI